MNWIELLTKENVGGIDLSLRAFMGSISIVLLALDIVPQEYTTVVGIIAFVGIFTASTRHCTPYVVLRIDTRNNTK